MNNNNFYKQLNEVEDFIELSNSKIYKKIPDDWYLLASDVKNSTINIQNGKYKEINMLGAMCIISILNLDKDIEFPYIFGGDGAFLIVPKSLHEKAKQAFLAIKKLAVETYDMNLRIASISIKELEKEVSEISIAKYKANGNYHQALIKGDALDEFDSLLKNSTKYHISDNIDENFVLNLDGLECRWSYIKTPQDISLSFILKCFDEKDYKSILIEVENIIGSIDSRHPVSEDSLKLSYSKRNLSVESSINSKNPILNFFNINKLRLANLMGDLLMKLNLGQWNSYKKRILSTSDIQKFDNIVRMVFSTTNEKNQQLKDYLDKLYEEKKIAYGIHESKYALMTCLIFERHGKHIHFVDTTNGGYAYAAKDFKKRIKDIN
jgi:hypothetical protein